MTRPPVNRRLDLGSILAIAAAAVAGIAIVVGFTIVGGPGHARDRRLDDITSQKIGQILGVVQCAFDASGIAPIDYPTAAMTRSAPAHGTPPTLCGSSGGMELKVGAGDVPAAPGDVTYLETGPTQIKICANFRIAQDQTVERQAYSSYGGWAIFGEGHPAGGHCQFLDLVKSSIASTVSPEPPYEVRPTDAPD